MAVLVALRAPAASPVVRPRMSCDKIRLTLRVNVLALPIRLTPSWSTSSSHTRSGGYRASRFSDLSRSSRITCMSAENGAPIQLATAKLAPNVQVVELLAMIRNWASSLTASAANPLQLSLKVDNIDNGVRMSLIDVKDGKICDLVYYNLTIEPWEESSYVFMAVRDGPHRNLAPPDEKIIFAQLQQFLKAAIPQCKR
mmetsp:Transcript_37151/g.69812  ORF Transcript_37151/g.69812 Transcript_37151/m.69812 type:complete len:198 (-) Transcript_37151:239-832(-)|eukprot:CAMPEP_0114236732 /NCGR_PEP_ID=MMETSP0058-20121206/7005_1 /TAXON_ID=36894 /ORGANISM="Pyramimonas parkeae, CCMP726" /LENGTH=197 /DNA_ID=CAMNT_0001348709 /DNA_START=43 /DNA_END=636 /DNA_ORIENTATION=+